MTCKLCGAENISPSKCAHFNGKTGFNNLSYWRKKEENAVEHECPFCAPKAPTDSEIVQKLESMKNDPTTFTTGSSEGAKEHLEKLMAPKAQASKCHVCLGTGWVRNIGVPDKEGWQNIVPAQPETKAPSVLVSEIEALLRADTSIEWSSGEYTIILPQILRALKVKQAIPESLKELMTIAKAPQEREAQEWLGQEALHHICTMYPGLWEKFGESAKKSLKNFINNNFNAALKRKERES